MKDKILKYLIKNKDNGYISGEKISNELDVSRVAVWKYISQLKEEGFIIESLRNKGYKLIKNPIDIHPLEIKESLNTSFIGKNIYYFDTLDSTNTMAKQHSKENGAVIISEEQTSGRGRLGRDWTSPKYKGLWFSIVLTPDMEPQYAPMISHVAAAALIKSFVNLGFSDVKCKWPNDIIINGKKVCGILTELSAELSRINHIVVGIGINVNLEENDFPMELLDKASSLKLIRGKDIERKALLVDILQNFEALYEKFEKELDIKTSINICKEYSAVLGKEVYLINKTEKEKVTAIDIDDKGQLIVRDAQGNFKKIISGEISVRGINGYI